MDTNLRERRLSVDYTQMNIFTKGMNTDTSDAYISPDQYRYAENLRVTSGESAGELRLIEGTQLLYPGQENLPIEGIILDVNYIKNIATIIRVVDVNTTPRWYIDVYDYDENKITTVAGPFTERIWPEGTDFTKLNEKILSTTIIWESDDNIKLYIADGIHEVMSLKILKTSLGFAQTNGTFSEVFSYSKILLPPLQVAVSSKSGTIDGVKVLYAYVLYQKYGNRTKLSQLSKWLNLYDTSEKGFRRSETSKAVDITIPAVSGTTLDYIRIYRVAYIAAGQLPKVDIVVNLPVSLLETTYTDIGLSIESVSVEEFISQLGLDIVPKILEQKNNYLFAANVKYSLDEIDKLFEDFDVRCFSTGDYVVVNGNERSFLNRGDVDYFCGFSEDNVKNHLLDDGQYLWDAASWKSNYMNSIGNSDVPNGVGKWLEWKYIISDADYDTSTSIDNTYMRNEVYRFGVRLFDLLGRASSVKWIADIKIPGHGYSEYSSNPHIFRKIKIEFKPINTDVENSLWEQVSRYEIVQCPRTRNDMFGITQGIVGYPVAAPDDTLCAPYYLSLDNFKIASSNAELSQGHFYYPNKQYLLFASPEVSYLQDDIYAILKTGLWKLLPIGFYYFDSTAVTVGNPQHDAFVLGHDGSWMKMQLVFDGTSYVVTGQTMHDNRAGSDPWTFAGYYVYTSELVPSTTTSNHRFLWEPITASNISIEGITKIESENHWNFSNSNWLTVLNHNTTVSGGLSYYNWTNPMMLYHAKGHLIDNEYEQINHYLTNYNNNEEYSWESNNMASIFRVPIAAGGRYLMLKRSPIVEPENQDPLWVLTAGVITNTDPIIYDENSLIIRQAPVRATLCLIYKDGVISYGGRNKFAIDRSTYVSAGITATSNESCIADNGDGFVSMFSFNHLHAVHNATLHDMNSIRVAYKIPIESHIDIKGQSSNYVYGLTNYWHYVLDTATSIDNVTQSEDFYLYNTAYGVTPDVVTYSPNDEVDKENQYTTRVHYSQPKINNEQIDNWTIFKTVDFLDVDTRYGEITGLKLFKDKLVFMLDKAAGVLSVNDRTIINDANNASIILGNAGVLLRYDYITTLYGMKPNQKVYAASNDALYWWDGYNKEIIQYQDGYSINQLQHLKQVDSYIQKYNESFTPTIFYDKRNKEAVFNVVNNESIVYNEKINAFTSIYTFSPIFHCDFIKSQIIIGPENNNLYEYNKSEGNTATLFTSDAKPKLEYIVNKESIYNKVFDIQTFGGRFYGGSEILSLNDPPNNLVKNEHKNTPLSVLTFTYNTPLKQWSKINGNSVNNYEYEYRLTIPRDGEGKNTNPFDSEKQWGNRMRGKTMQCELKSSSNNLDFSLQYIITKFRTSWT